jgi:hypothetical protein
MSKASFKRTREGPVSDEEDARVEEEFRVDTK